MIVLTWNSSMRRKAKPNVTKTTTLPEPSHSPAPEQGVVATTQESPPLHFTHESFDTDIIPSDVLDVPQTSDKALELYYKLPISWELLLGENDVLPLINIENQDNDDDNDSPKAAEGGPLYEAELFTSNDELIIPPSNPDHVSAWKRRLLLNCETRLSISTGVHN